ncbi:MAG TPA: YqeG family HAD IIIA-type phosphatase [Armatimonadota bacterium]|jgi:HAD superfamily phosphatase (TIGR01668 family)|nr:YqeG family HAD IIIA-type phosphatase [Armatimonadota bacterium]HOM71698.1 YqeG family HAD IIIA-type phosphatase [Armatimonadota bacterium]HPP75173.1 YqeG family HAD IIIA-type phosphatase [Armatimonadota bacterium]
MSLFDYLCPKICVPSLSDVDLDDITARGIKTILLDLDNTILPWKDYKVPPQSSEWIKSALDRGIKLFIASNTRNPKRLSTVARELGIPYAYKIGKPGSRGLRAAMESLGAAQENTAIIGDQIFTDVLGGNRLLLFTILVQPMHRREFIGTKVSRIFEKPVLAMLRRRGLLGTKRQDVKSQLQG